MYSSSDSIQLDMSALAAAAPPSPPKQTRGGGTAGGADMLSERLWLVPPRTSKPIIVAVVSSPQSGLVQVWCIGSEEELAGTPIRLSCQFRAISTFARITRRPMPSFLSKSTLSTVRFGFGFDCVARPVRLIPTSINRRRCLFWAWRLGRFWHHDAL